MWKPPITAWTLFDARDRLRVADGVDDAGMTARRHHDETLALDVDDHSLVVDRRIVVDEPPVALEEHARGAAVPHRNGGSNGIVALDLPGCDRARTDAARAHATRRSRRRRAP